MQFVAPPVILASASVVGKKEGEGPLRDCFDSVSQDTYFGTKSWEQAESAMLRQCFDLVCQKAGLPPEQLDYVLSGDLLNQCVGSAYAMRDIGVPYLGLYGACSTMAESLSLAAMLIDGGYAEHARRAHELALLLCRAAVPVPAGIRRRAHTDCAVDRHRAPARSSSGAAAAGRV